MNFFSQRKIDHNIIRQAFEETFGQQLNNILEENFGGDFPFHYEAWYSNIIKNKRMEVDLVQRTTELAQTEILIPDEDLDPYKFIHCVPSRQPISISVDMEAYDQEDQLTIDEPCEEFWGTFALEFTPDDQQQSELLEHLPPSAKFRVYDASVFSSYFREAQESEPLLKNFNWFAGLIPRVGYPWHSKDEKSIVMKQRFEELSALLKMNLCLFPTNGESIQNIPGGSDSERFCVLFRPGEVKTIVYKKRRASW